ncbi:MAG: permease [Candidatus Omnitrophica bacterium]|nr:permease [Candidatus Omnitrophota bacterium]
MDHFIHVFIHYLWEVVPALMVGFGISGFVHELIPEDLVLKHLGSGGIKPILYSTIVGTLLPVCCWGSLPIAVSFQKKGARLGPVLAFLIATPATSISALLVAYNVIGLSFTVYIFFSVIIMGLIMGLIGDRIKYQTRPHREVSCPHCKIDPGHAHTHAKKTLREKFLSAVRYAYFELPKEIGFELFFGLLLAAAVATFMPIKRMVSIYLSGWFGYVFSVVFGILTYLCSTASVPLIDSLVRQGMSHGAGMTLLLIGPVTSYGTMLVIRKEYGIKVLAIFLATLIVSTVFLGIGYQVFIDHIKGGM